MSPELVTSEARRLAWSASSCCLTSATCSAQAAWLSDMRPHVAHTMLVSSSVTWHTSDYKDTWTRGHTTWGEKRSSLRPVRMSAVACRPWPRTAASMVLVSPCVSVVSVSCAVWGA